jgi:hypothetical protein
MNEEWIHWIILSGTGKYPKDSEEEHINNAGAAE